MKARLLAMFAVLATPAAAQQCRLGKFADLPVTMRGLQPIVSLSINGTPLDFLADSGGFYSVITPGTAKQLDLKLTTVPGNMRISGIGGMASAMMTRVADLGLSGETLHGVYFLVGGSEIGGSGGILGQNVLGIGDAEYDLAHGAIRLFNPHDCRDESVAYWANGQHVSVMPIEDTGRRNQHIIGSVVVNGVKLRAVFDTGAATSVLSKSAAAKAGVTPESPGARAIGVARGMGRQVVRNWIAPFASIKIGDEEVSNTRMRFGDFSSMDFDMLVGADFFLSHRIYVSNAQHRLYMTYNGGPVFALDARPSPVNGAATASAGEPEPSDADSFARRGAARAARRDFEAAVADMDRAIELKPADPRFLVTRAQIRLALRQPLRAKADLDAALQADPGNANALMVRAGMYLMDRDKASARADADTLARALPREDDRRFALAQLYGVLDANDRAIAEFDTWIAIHPVDSKRPDALNGRCWRRALAGVDLSKALSDCSAAIRERPGNAAFLDSRGLVKLRMGDTRGAIADYDATLAINPKQGWSLFGRGLAKTRSGDATGGKQDVDAAVALMPGLPAEARRAGIIPPDGTPR